MDPNGLSALSHLRAKPVGKVRRRALDLRTATYHHGGRGEDLRSLDLSHSESERLAVDALMGEGGVRGYLELLAAEREVDFLSEQEKSYILTNQRDGPAGCAEGVTVEDDDGGSQQCDGGSQQCDGGPVSLGRCSASEDSDDGSYSLEPCLPPWNQNGIELSGSDQQSQSRVEVVLKSDNREGSMKDLIREQIRKAQKTLVIVVDTFSDIELLCDILEAVTKRNVYVHLLLDQLNVQHFLDMCVDLKINGKHFPKLSVRSVSGHRYCTKTGRKISGQITETFIISDWTQVLTGSYSFSWLSWQVNRIFIVLLEGRLVTSFHQEFRRLYLRSQPVPPLFHTTTTSASHAIPNTPTDPGMRSLLKRQSQVNAGDNGNKAEIPTATDPTHVALSKLEVERNRAETYVLTLALCQAQAQAERFSRWKTEIPQRLKAGQGLSNVNASAEGPWRAPQGYASDAMPTHTSGLMPSRSFRDRNPGIDKWCGHGSSNFRAHFKNPQTVGGPLYQELHRNSRAATERGTATANLDTLRRVQRSSSEVNPRLHFDTQPLRRTLSQQTQMKGNTQGVYIRNQGQRQWPEVQLSPQTGAQCRTQSQKRLISSHPNRPAFNNARSFLPDTGSDVKALVKVPLEPGFSMAATNGRPQDPHSYPVHKFGPPQRHWIVPQLHTRHPVHDITGENGTGGRKVEPGRRDGKCGAGVMLPGRTKGVLSKPAIFHRGATLSARLKENHTM